MDEDEHSASEEDRGDCAEGDGVVRKRDRMNQRIDHRNDFNSSSEEVSSDSGSSSSSDSSNQSESADNNEEEEV